MRMVSSCWKTTWLASMLAIACVPDHGAPQRKVQGNTDDEGALRSGLSVIRQPPMDLRKFCACSDGSWGDTVQVPDTWTVATCVDFCCDEDGEGPDRGIGAGSIEVGCMTTDPPSTLYGNIAACGGDLPLPPEECGW